MTDLGDRMKAFEDCYRFTIPRKSHVVIRVDGKAFHSIGGLEKPFDEGLRSAMVNAACETAEEIQGFVSGYQQSDEVSFYLTDQTDNPNSEAWFGNGLSKLVSVTASLFTRAFNRGFLASPQVFDARAFVLPFDEVPNYFLWRIRDWNRNSLSMFARSFFSAKQLYGKAAPEVHERLHAAGANWADLSDELKNGTFIRCDRVSIGLDRESVGYEPLRALILSQTRELRATA